MKSFSFVPILRGELAQITLLSSSNGICLSQEEYVVTHTPRIAGGRFVVREVNRNRHILMCLKLQ